ncbi:MAG: response regulator transcription factor [Pirellulales bacterium]|nr:response regulator transcription factor [Pirellulales bacterium]
MKTAVMTKEHILVVDDEEDLLELVNFNLTKEGYRVTCLNTGEDATKRVRSEMPDLVILDLLLPRVDGLELCRMLKSDERTKNIPIVMLTAKGEEADVVTGLELGADDYITKPFSPRVLMARIKAVLRRSQRLENEDDDKVIRTGSLTIHPGRHEVILAGKPVALTLSEFRLLHFLAQRPGWVFTRSQIVDAVKGNDYPVTERSVDVQIVGLRKKLGDFGRTIETVRGVGYRFRE